jgi:hypothetical protein
LADASALFVPHPDFVALTPRRVIVGAADDSWSVVEPILIVSLDYKSNKKNSNGRRRRGK